MSNMTRIATLTQKAVENQGVKFHDGQFAVVVEDGELVHYHDGRYISFDVLCDMQEC